MNDLVKTIDLYGFGLATIDDFIEVASFPESGGKVNILARRRQAGGLCLTALVAALARNRRACTAVTDRPRGCWFIDGDTGREVQHQSAFKVKVVVTTGCGDVFHGSYTAAIIWGMPVNMAIQVDSAAATIKATQPGGQHGAPDHLTMRHFLQESLQASFHQFAPFLKGWDFTRS